MKQTLKNDALGYAKLWNNEKLKYAKSVASEYVEGTSKP